MAPNRFHLVVKALTVCVAASLICNSAAAQQPAAPTQQISQSTVDELVRLLAAHEARIRELEQRLSAQSSGAVSITPATLAVPVAAAAPVMADMPASSVNAATPAPAPIAALVPTDQAHETIDDPHDHMMSLGGGAPALKIRGFFDFNYGVGSIANPLIFPEANNGCGTCGNPATPSHNAFQAGEFDLFLSSKISDQLSFVSEIVLGPSTTNEFGIDIERYQLTYRPNKYFSASAGRFHTSIG